MKEAIVLKSREAAVATHLFRDIISTRSFNAHPIVASSSLLERHGPVLGLSVPESAFLTQQELVRPCIPGSAARGFLFRYKPAHRKMLTSVSFGYKL